MGAPEQIVIAEAVPFEKPQGSTALMKIIERAAFDPQFDASKLAVLLDVKLKWEADEARKQFEDAFQQFRRNAPAILKTHHVAYKDVEYDHAELDKITPILSDALLAVGIVHSWEQSDVNGRTTVTCVLEGFGHTRRASTLSGPADTSGGKNNIQAIGSTVTYLQRYTLLSACGIAAKGKDDDGKTEGMSATAIDEYSTVLKDASSLDQLKTVFKECWDKAKKANDRGAQVCFQKVYEAKKRELWDHRQ